MNTEANMKKSGQASDIKVGVIGYPVDSWEKDTEGRSENRSSVTPCC